MCTDRVFRWRNRKLSPLNIVIYEVLRDGVCVWSPHEVLVDTDSCRARQEMSFVVKHVGLAMEYGRAGQSNSRSLLDGMLFVVIR